MRLDFFVNDGTHESSFVVMAKAVRAAGATVADAIEKRTKLLMRHRVKAKSPANASTAEAKTADRPQLLRFRLPSAPGLQTLALLGTRPAIDSLHPTLSEVFAQHHCPSRWPSRDRAMSV